MARDRPNQVLLLLVLVCLTLAGLSLYTGVSALPHAELLGLFRGQALSSQWSVIVWEIRLPRTLMALGIGAGLGIAGAVLQAVFRNPLAEPSVLGISSGATAFALATMVLLPGWFAAVEQVAGTLTMPTLAALGAALTLTLLMVLAGRQNWDPQRIILLGISVNVFAGALLGLSAYWATDQQLRILSFWSLGSLAASNVTQVLVMAMFLALGCAVLLRHWRFLNALLLGESEAFHLGFPVVSAKRQCLLAVALISGAAVAFTGIIGFVGLVVPHVMRLLTGPNHRYLLWYAMLAGGAFLLAADTLARLVMAPLELPVGILTAFVGGPFLVLLLSLRSSWQLTR